MMDTEDSEWTETVAVSDGGAAAGEMVDLDDEEAAASGGGATGAAGGGEDDMPDLDDLELEDGGIEEVRNKSALNPTSWSLNTRP